MVIFLVGFMGSGKNWWGSALADHTGIPFYDLDEAVEQAEGMDIVSIFREKAKAISGKQKAGCSRNWPLK